MPGRGIRILAVWITQRDRSVRGQTLTEPAFISIGSNIQPEQHLPQAVIRLRGLGRLTAVSVVYENPAVGGDPQAHFLNAAALVQVELSPKQIRDALREIEAGLGRVRTADKYAPRTIDLDLALLGNRVELDPPLPDPEIAELAHLAIPLAELSPDFVHPVLGRTLRAIAEQVPWPEHFVHRPDLDATIQALLQEAERQPTEPEEMNPSHHSTTQEDA